MKDFNRSFNFGILANIYISLASFSQPSTHIRFTGVFNTLVEDCGQIGYTNLSNIIASISSLKKYSLKYIISGEILTILHGSSALSIENDCFILFPVSLLIQTSLECVVGARRVDYWELSKGFQSKFQNLVCRNLTLTRPMHTNEVFFNLSKVKKSSFLKSDVTDPRRFLMSIFWKIPI